MKSESKKHEKRDVVMTVLEKISVPCDGATLLVEDVLSGINVYLQSPDGVREEVVSIRVVNGQVTCVRKHMQSQFKKEKND